MNINIYFRDKTVYTAFLIITNFVLIVMVRDVFIILLYRLIFKLTAYLVDTLIQTFLLSKVTQMFLLFLMLVQVHLTGLAAPMEGIMHILSFKIMVN